jgi:type I restriction enzyme R subunit
MSISKERGYFNPPSQSGGQECPPSDQFLDPFAPIQQHTHRVPHWQQGSVYYFVTWRLADSLPRDKLDRWNEDRTAWIRSHPEPWDAETEIDYHAQFSRAIDEWLDAGEGSCVLRDATLSRLVADALLHFDGVRYVMDAFVIMPNHVHVLFRLLAPYRLESVVKSWKGFTAREVNQCLGRRGRLWQADYWDRLIRNESHWLKCREYIKANPLKARLSRNEYVLFAMERGFSNPRG